MENNDSIRAGGICIHNNRIVLIHRINLSKEKERQEYYAIPGGTVENGEKIENAVIREMKEETNLDVKLGDFFYEMQDENPRGGNRKHYYYMCEYIKGEPKLRDDSEEAKEMKEGVHFYKPLWVDLADIEKITVFPRPVKEEIINKLIKKTA